VGSTQAVARWNTNGYARTEAYVLDHGHATRYRFEVNSIPLGPVAHFSLAVHDPRGSAQWWLKNFDLQERLATDERVLLGNDAIVFALVRGRPDPAVLTHLAFHAADVSALEFALAQFRKNGVFVEDPGDEIGPVAFRSRSLGLWFHDPDGYRWELYAQSKE
jgi:catechol 2,3-dioxygenase-like lactoylglutathione lyase family enzyme